MTELEWQSLFIVAAAFFVGAVVACGLKRRFYYRTGAGAGLSATTQPASSAAVPKPEQAKVEVPESPAPAPQVPSATASFIPAAQPKAEPIAAPEPASFVPVARPKAEPIAAEAAPQPATPSPEPVAMAAPSAPSSAAATAVADPTPTTAPVATSEPTPLRSGAERADVAGLRSVRSEALRGAGEGAAPTKSPDDLKRIRGVGVLIERKLNSLGVTTYEQIANWTGADIVRISQILDFKGRIERENWIEQARILSTGGQTEFSRRFNPADA